MTKRSLRYLPFLVLLSVISGPPVHAQSGTPAANWQTYVNDRFGTRFDYPADLFGPGEASANGNGRRFVAKNAQLEMFGWENSGGETASSLRQRLAGSDGYEEVTYSRSGDNWLVLSGFRGDNIFYEKYFFRPGAIEAFGMEFPRAEKPFYAPIVERIEDSFRAGR